MRPDKAVYAGGETMKLAVLGRGVEPVFVDLLKDGQTLLTQQIEMQDGRGQCEIDLPPELFGTIEINAYRFGACRAGDSQVASGVRSASSAAGDQGRLGSGRIPAR